MATLYLTIYLLFLIGASLLFGLMVFKLKLPSPRFLIFLFILFIFIPMLLGYFYVAYFDSLTETEVPNVSGLIYDEAAQKLKEANLHAHESGRVFEMNYPEGYVISQRPEGGRIVKEGRTVNLIVSSGPKKVPTPNLLGKRYQEAANLLAAGTLRVGQIKYEKNQAVPEGTIVAQEPSPSEEAELGGAVDLIISTSYEVAIQ